MNNYRRIIKHKIWFSSIHCFKFIIKKIQVRTYSVTGKVIIFIYSSHFIMIEDQFVLRISFVYKSYTLLLTIIIWAFEETEVHDFP